MYTCPHCNKPGITFLRKMFLGPALPATCKSCKKKIGVSYKHIIIIIPILIAVVAINFIDNISLKIFLSIILVTLATIYQIRWVQLIPK